MAAVALTALWLFLLRKLIFRAGQEFCATPGLCAPSGSGCSGSGQRRSLSMPPCSPLHRRRAGAAAGALSAWLARHTTLTAPLLALPVVFLSGLIQEPVKMLALLPAACRTPRSSYLPLGALAGGAYGGMEALLLFAAVFPYPGLGALNLAAAIWERAFTILLHLALTAFVAHRFSRGWKAGLGASPWPCSPLAAGELCCRGAAALSGAASRRSFT